MAGESFASSHDDLSRIKCGINLNIYQRRAELQSALSAGESARRQRLLFPMVHYLIGPGFFSTNRIASSDQMCFHYPNIQLFDVQ
jgi:hypothetical protein